MKTDTATIVVSIYDCSGACSHEHCLIGEIEVTNQHSAKMVESLAKALGLDVEREET